MQKLSVSLINFYQVFSFVLFAGACRYEITCSQYTKKAILKHGFWKGGALGIKRILSCR